MYVRICVLYVCVCADAGDYKRILLSIVVGNVV